MRKLFNNVVAEQLREVLDKVGSISCLFLLSFQRACTLSYDRLPFPIHTDSDMKTHLNFPLL